MFEILKNKFLFQNEKKSCFSLYKWQVYQERNQSNNTFHNCLEHIEITLIKQVKDLYNESFNTYQERSWRNTERLPMFMNWWYQYCENNHLTKSNIRVQFTPSQYCNIVQQIVLVKWMATCRRTKIHLHLSLYGKLNSKWIKDRNIRPHTLNLIEKKRWRIGLNFLALEKTFWKGPWKFRH